MTVLKPEPLNGTDAALWDIERDPSLRTTVVSVLVLDRRLDPDRLTDVLDVASRLVPRLRQRVREAALGIGIPHWVLADDFDVHDHVQVATNDGDGFDAVLRIAAECATVPFDRARPLWQCIYVDGWDDRRSAVVLKVHHSLVDGVAGVALLDVLLDARRRVKRRDPDTLPDYRSADSDDHVHLPSLDSIGGASNAVGRLALDAVAHPLRAATSIVDAVSSAARILAPSGRALSPLFTARGPNRRLGVHTADLTRLHDAAARHGLTVNDLFVAAVVEGTARFHRDRSAALDALRVTMPVSIRTGDSPTGGNQWVPIRFRMPADIDDPIERMRLVHEITNRSHAEPAMGFSHTLAGAIQVLPAALSSAVAAEMMHGVDVLVTNVPGLHEDRYLAGACVEHIYPFAPTGGAAFNVALLSHRSTACFGMMFDADAVQDADDLHESIAIEIDAAIVAAEHSPVAPKPVGAAPQVADSTRLTALDFGFLQMETDDAPMHLGAVFVLDGAPLRDDDGQLRLGEIRRHVASRIVSAPAYIRRLHDVPFGIHRPLWVDDPNFDVAQHVVAISLEGCVRKDGDVGDLGRALALCADINSERLDRSRPLWELWLIDGMGDGDVVMLLKIHHALTDGVGSVELATALFDFEPGSEHDVDRGIEHARLAGSNAQRPPSKLRTFADAALQNLTEPVQFVRTTAQAMVTAPSDVLRQAGVAAVGLRDLFGPGAITSASELNKPVGPLREVAPIRLDLDDIDAVRTEHGGSVNDVALCAIAGGLRAWFESHEQQLPEVHAMCPVSQRTTDSGVGVAGNHVGAMLISLPLAEPDPVRRLQIIHERTGRAKARHDGEGVARVFEALDRFPSVPAPAIRQFMAHQPFVNVVVTNVPGPPAPMWFIGARITSVVPIVPLVANTALGIALFSYDATLTIGLHADPERFHDLEIIADAVVDDIAVLRST